MSIRIGSVVTRNRVFLAPMSGVTDLPFRRLAHDLGAGLVVSEMVASAELARGRDDMVRRARGGGGPRPFVVQLAGREARWMAEGARIAESEGADIIDINMGCPARQVAGKLSGAALMRNLDHAEGLIAATVAAVRVPVTLKMRLGWDHATMNAPALAVRAQNAGAAMITVHGRTRCQFYRGQADWARVGEVKASVRVPVIANGDCRSLDSARRMLALSGADGVMIGRGCYGAPWRAGEIAAQLDAGSGGSRPDTAASHALVCTHYDAMLSFYGAQRGARMARKHLGWYLDEWVNDGVLDACSAKRWRARLMHEHNPDQVTVLLARLGRDLDRQRTATRHAA